jgi:tripartite ATP-independent transporter DctP family solute receptor
MKRIILVLCIAMVAVAMVSARASQEESSEEAAATEVVNMRFAHYAAVDHAGNIAAQMFADAVEERTGGAIHIDVFPNNELGDPPSVLEANVLGAIDMSLPTQGQLDKYNKKFAAVMLPFIFRDLEHAWAVLDGPFMEAVGPELEEEGLIFLSNWEWGFRNLTNSVHPINTPADVVGLKIRTPPEVQLAAAMAGLGAEVQQIAWTELPQALQQGVIDGQENPVSVIYSNNLYELQPYLAMTMHVYNSMVHVMSKDVYDSLTAEQQQIIREESVRAGNWMRQTLAEADAHTIELLEEAGMQVTWPDRTLFQAEMAAAWDEIRDYAGAENVDAFIEMANSL